MITVRLKLSARAVEALQRPISGQGGFQSLLRQLQRSVDNEQHLVLTPALIAKIVRYVEDYGGGGFQGRLDTVLADLQKLAEILRPLLNHAQP
jgi:hypothetical protein